MGRGQHSAQGKGNPRGQHQGARGGAIHKKAAPSALAAAIAARKQLPKVGASATASSISLLLGEELAQAEIQSDQLLQLVRECMDDTVDGQIALTELGGVVRARAMRQCLQTASGPLHKQVKAKWGGWEGFLRAHASEEFVVANGRLVRRPTMAQDDVLVYRRAADASDVKPDELGLQALNVLEDTASSTS